MIRVALLPWLPAPQPAIHDEFGHLLVADTLMKGRLANPPHPLSRHLDTIYVLQRPAYASIYPIGQGAVLALGQLMGHPFIGVLLSVGLMGGAICWMLYGCLPREWAGIGGLLASVHFGLLPQWIDTYWGGALCAFGGALLFGSILRLSSARSTGLAAILGLGWAIVWFTRPFEALPLLALSWIAIIVTRVPWQAWLVLAAVQGSAGCLTLAHNHAITGSYRMLPYQLSQRTQGVPQTLLWQKPIHDPLTGIPEIQAMYEWQRQKKDWVTQHPLKRFLDVGFVAWRFFINSWYTLPFLAVFLFRDRLAMAAMLIIGGALLVSALYPFFLPHYFASYACVVFFLIVRGMMLLSRRSAKLILFLALCGSLKTLRIIPAHRRDDSLREAVSKHLLRQSGQHVVFVRYSGKHDLENEWIYNAANVDASPIVWCRYLGEDDAEVYRYYLRRTFWIATVGTGVVRVQRQGSAQEELNIDRR